MALPPTLWDVRSKLYELFRDAVAAAPEIRGRRPVVFEGTRSREATPELFLLVGAGTTLDDQLATGNDPWGRLVGSSDPMSPSWRIKEGEIDCAAVAWSGSPDDRPSLREDVSALVAVCEQALVGDPRLGGLLEGENFAELTVEEFRDPHTDKGPFAEVVFTVSYRQRAVF